MFLVKVFTEGKKVVGKAFLSKKRFLVESRGFFYEIAKSLKFTAEHTENAKAPENLSND